MSNEMQEHISSKVGRQSLQPMEWTYPRLKYAWDEGARDQKYRTQEDWNALFGKRLSGTDLRHLVVSGEADGLLEGNNSGRSGRTWRCSNLARLLFLNTADAIEQAMPLFAEHHMAVYATTYDYEWADRPESLLESVYDTNNVKEAGLRARAFPSIKQFADATKARDTERCRELIASYPPYVPGAKRSRRLKSAPEAMDPEPAPAPEQSNSSTSTVSQPTSPVPLAVPQGITLNVSPIFYFGVDPKTGQVKPSA